MAEEQKKPQGAPQPESKPKEDSPKAGNSKPKNKNRRGKGKNGKPNPKPDPKPESSPKPSNAVQWYKNYSTLFEQATSVNTEHITGSKYRTTGRIKMLQNALADSGVTIVYFSPTCGGCHDSSAPLNRATKMMWNRYRGKFTNTVPFQPNDLGMYFIAYGNVLAYANHINRLLNILKTYDTASVTMPKLIYRALGLDWNVERANYAKNVFNLDVLLRQMDFLVLPKQFNYFDKCLWMFNHIYYEDASDYRGNFVFNAPYHIFKFDSQVTTVDGDFKASGLVAQAVYDTTSIAEMIEILAEMISALVDSDDIRNISAWLKSNDGVNVLFSNAFTEKIGLSPAFSDEYKYQVKNLRINTKYKNVLVDNPVCQNVDTESIDEPAARYSTTARPFGDGISTTDAQYLLEQWMMTFNKKPTGDDIMTATRFVWGAEIVEHTTTDRVYYEIKFNFDTWIPVELHYKSLNVESPDGLLEDYQFVSNYAITSSIASPEETIKIIQALRYSEFMPNMLLGIQQGNTLKDAGFYMAQELNYNFLLDNTNISALNEVAIFSEFYSEV